MRTLIITIGGTLTPGDLLLVEYTHPQRGGVSAIKHQIREPVDRIVTDVNGAKTVETVSETFATVAQMFIDEINRGQAWPAGEFEGVIRDDKSFVIKTRTPTMDEVVFKAEVQGAQTETLSLEVL